MCNQLFLNYFSQARAPAALEITAGARCARALVGSGPAAVAVRPKACQIRACHAESRSKCCPQGSSEGETRLWCHELLKFNSGAAGVARLRSLGGPKWSLKIIGPSPTSSSFKYVCVVASRMSSCSSSQDAVHGVRDQQHYKASSRSRHLRRSSTPPGLARSVQSLSCLQKKHQNL